MPARRTARLVLTVAAFAPLSSCSPPPIDIAAERDGDRLRLTLSQRRGFIFGGSRAPCVREIALHESETADRDHPRWQIVTTGGVQCLELQSVALGEVPGGWQETVPLSAVRGRTYTVAATGIGSGEILISF